MPGIAGSMWRWAIYLWCWCELTWTLLTWTLTPEQIITGAVISAAVASACAPLGSVAPPWALLRPRRLRAAAVLAVQSVARITRANLRLTRAIWSRSGPPSGMIIVETDARADAELTIVGILTSLAVDSQLVDLDRRRHELQYHALFAAGVDRDRVNGPVERVLVAGRP